VPATVATRPGQGKLSNHDGARSGPDTPCPPGRALRRVGESVALHRCDSRVTARAAGLPHARSGFGAGRCRVVQLGGVSCRDVSCGLNGSRRASWDFRRPSCSSCDCSCHGRIDHPMISRARPSWWRHSPPNRRFARARPQGVISGHGPILHGVVFRTGAGTKTRPWFRLIQIRRPQRYGLLRCNPLPEPAEHLNKPILFGLCGALRYTLWYKNTQPGTSPNRRLRRLCARLRRRVDFERLPPGVA